MLSTPPKFVGIAGASGSGKSHFSKILQSRIDKIYGTGASLIINEDLYYRATTGLDAETRSQINYDHPDSLEHDLLVEHLNVLRKGGKVDLPQYDYTIHDRSAETTLVGSCRLIIVEGILLFHEAELRKQMELKIFVDTPLDICLLRRLRRDTKERGRSVESVLSQYETTVRPMFFEFVQPSQTHADIVLNFDQNEKEATDSIVDHVSSLVASK